MERIKFYKKMDLVAEHWYVDANPPVTGVGYVRKDGTNGPRRRSNQRGEENPINETSGEVQIMQWRKKSAMCLQCCKSVEDKQETINLNKGQIKCSCGLKYPIANIATIS